jgi:hypothetical protein
MNVRGPFSNSIIAIISIIYLLTITDKYIVTADKIDIQKNIFTKDTADGKETILVP